MFICKIWKDSEFFSNRLTGFLEVVNYCPLVCSTVFTACNKVVNKNSVCYEVYIIYTRHISCRMCTLCRNVVIKR
jgi:hypothetical protein